MQTLTNPVTLGEQMDADAPSRAAPSPAAVTVPAAPMVYQAGLSQQLAHLGVTPGGKQHIEIILICIILIWEMSRDADVKRFRLDFLPLLIL